MEYPDDIEIFQDGLIFQSLGQIGYIAPQLSVVQWEWTTLHQSTKLQIGAQMTPI